ncbi:MAG: ABC transporter substrate-binding protein [Lachnospiraceae bacterium]
MRKVVALGLAAVTAMSLAGCGGGKSSDGSSTTAGSTTSAKAAASGEKTKIVVWTDNRHDLEYMNSVVDQFNNENDHIEIEYVVQTENYENLIQMATSSGEAPDIIAAVNSAYFMDFVNSGIIQPVNQWLYADTEYVKVNEPDNHKYEGWNSVGDDVYHVPCGKRSGARMIVNQDILDKNNLTMPTKLSELLEVCKTISDNGEGKEYGMIIPGASGPFERWLEHSAEMSGITPYDYVNGRFDFTGYREYCQFMRDMFDAGAIFPGSASMKIDPIRVQFAEGVVGMEGNASQEATVFTEQFPAQCNWSVYQLPTLDGTIRGAEQCNPNNGYQMSSITKHPGEAWEVISYFGSEAILKGYLEGGYTLPMSDYMNRVVDTSKIGRMADFAGADYEAVYPVMPTVTPEGESFRDALWNACLPEGPDIDQTIETLNKTYNEALDSAVAMGKTKRLVIKNYNPLHPNEGTAEYLEE